MYLCGFALFFVVLGISTIHETNARSQRFYEEDSQQSQELSQVPQRPHLQTKPLWVQQQQRPQPLGQFSQNQERPGQFSQTQQRPGQSQQRPQIQPPQQSDENLSDENEQNLLQQLEDQDPQVILGDLDSNEQQQFVQDAQKYEQELEKQAEKGGHKGQATKEDAKVVDDKNKTKPWYVRLKNWGEKKINQLG